MTVRYVLLRRDVLSGRVVRSKYPLPNRVRVAMQKLPLAGQGYLAGEFPGGTTTVEGAPTPAEVRAIWRGPAGHPADGAVCGYAQSGVSGTWLIQNLNESLKYDVVGRKEGFNDVIVAGVTPTSMVDITYTGDITSNETFTGALGHLELVGGIPPYSVAAETPFPSGLFPVVSGRNLIIDGTTDADEVASFDVKVTSSNGAEKIIPLQLVVGFKAPANFKAETVVVDDVFSVSLTWETANSTQQIRVYRSVTPFDIDDLPEPIATLSGTSTTYTDDDVIEDDHFYYMVTAVCEQYSLESEAVAVLVTGGDPHWDKMVSLLHFDDNLTDQKGRTWVASSSPTFVAGKFDKALRLSNLALSTAYDSDFDWNTNDFTIECFVKAASWASFSEAGRVNGIPMLIGRMGQLNDTNQWSFGPVDSGKLHFYYFSGGQKLLIVSSGIAPVNEWVHIAFCKDTTSAYVAINGVVTSAALPSSIVLQSVSEPITIGGYNYNSADGYIDELRITKGVARYTENFTPPTDPFPNK